MGGGGGSGGYRKDCRELGGLTASMGFFFLSCTVLLSKCFTNLIGIPEGRLPAVCLMVRVSNLVHG